MPGWIIRSRSAASVAFESSSDQISWRLPVAWSITTIGWRLANARAMLVSGTAPVRFIAAWVSSPGTWSRIALPGLNPSLRSYGPTAICWPLVLVGIAAAGSLTRTPVTLCLSGRVKRLSGNGNRHGRLEYGWQSAAGLAATAVLAPNAAVAATAATSADSRASVWLNLHAIRGAPL